MLPRPPWIILLSLVTLVVSIGGTEVTSTTMTEQTTITEAETEDVNVTLTRSNRGTSEQDQNSITPTYYLARSYTNEAGERRNVLIPVQATPATEADRVETTVTGTPTATAAATYQSGISPAPDGDGYSPTKIYALTQDMLMTLHNAGLIANPAPLTLQPTQPSSTLYTSNQASSVYSVSVPVTSPKVQAATVYPSPEAHRLTAENIKAHAYLAAKQKTAASKQNSINRHRQRVRPNKNKYTSTKLQFSLPTSPSPYTNKVRFELEDARIPSSSSIALQPVTASLGSTAQTYTATATAASSSASTGLSQYLEAEPSKQFYVAHEGGHVEYVPAQQPQAQLQHLTNVHATAVPQANSSPLHYIQSNAITAARQQQSPTPPPLGPPALPQFSSNLLGSNVDERNPAPHVEYVKITDIEVAPKPTQSLKTQQYHQEIRRPQSSGLSRPHFQYLKFGGHAFQGGAGQSIQYFPQQPTRATPSPHHQQYILQVQKVRVNPRPQVTFASDSGLRSGVKVPVSQNQFSKPVQYSLSALKSTPEPAVEFIQSNEVTFAPEVSPETPRPTTPEPIQTHQQYVQEIEEVVAGAPNPHLQPQPQPQQQQQPQLQQLQYSTASTASPNDPTPSIELEYTPGKLPPMVEDAFNILKQTDQLPQKITPDNIDGSIKTLGLILQRLQQYQRDPATYQAGAQVQKQKEQLREKPGHVSQETNYSPSGGSTPGRPGIDYPTYHKIPKTSFDCTAQRYKGFFGDPETQCQVWHYCDLNGGQASFLCPNGTIFSQVALTCDWWFNVKCATTSQLYVLNERLYKYILPFAPSFPEDYAGPGVDRYLTAKFEEQEAKNNNKVRSLVELVESVSITTPQPSLSESATARPAESSTTSQGPP